MKKKYLEQILLICIIAAVVASAAWFYLYKPTPGTSTVVYIEKTPPAAPQAPPSRAPMMVPEYREPPLKEYRQPMRQTSYQQVGLLISGSETLPLYGKESLTRRNQWHYYTTTPGNQVYPLPVSTSGRDCMEDIGCSELYGNETLSVTGRDGTDFQAKIYRTENFPYMM
jgi:hypothetical protein